MVSHSLVLQIWMEVTSGMKCKLFILFGHGRFYKNVFGLTSVLGIYIYIYTHKRRKRTKKKQTRDQTDRQTSKMGTQQRRPDKTHDRQGWGKTSQRRKEKVWHGRQAVHMTDKREEWLSKEQTKCDRQWVGGTLQKKTKKNLVFIWIFVIQALQGSNGCKEKYEDSEDW